MLHGKNNVSASPDLSGRSNLLIKSRLLRHPALAGLLALTKHCYITTLKEHILVQKAIGGQNYRLLFLGSWF